SLCVTSFRQPSCHGTLLGMDSAASRIRNQRLAEGRSGAKEGMENAWEDFLASVPRNRGHSAEKSIPGSVIPLLGIYSNTSHPLSGIVTRLLSKQASPSQPAGEGPGPPSRFDPWSRNFCMLQKHGELVSLILGSPDIKRLVTDLIPAAASHSALSPRWLHSILWNEQESAKEAGLRKQRVRSVLGEQSNWGQAEEELMKQSPLDQQELKVGPQSVSSQRLGGHTGQADCLVALLQPAPPPSHVLPVEENSESLSLVTQI
uniref:Uncharacterized protein n=1 Tax=Sus scrofa TaxID=9823 RepID=A0A8D1TNY2_PIG